MTNEQIAKKYAKMITGNITLVQGDASCLCPSTESLIQQAINEATAGDDALVEGVRKVVSQLNRAAKPRACDYSSAGGGCLRCIVMRVAAELESYVRQALEQRSE